MSPAHDKQRKAVQAGARAHPADPGHEAELEARPRFEAPQYRGSGKPEGFAARKGAIHAMNKSLASPWIQCGIRVNAVAPGPVCAGCITGSVGAI